MESMKEAVQKKLEKYQKKYDELFGKEEEDKY
jgi:hypothetical protein